ncbi:Ni/Fe-hydrogenase, b-type cytochrome subunit [Shewanella cyperi]|uniref:Ni/Fe-hydrogenase, b-type cytochrome subunit n=1 Tax=Shewanella cyperi TaxID=2814292 RepID=A0A975AJN7_9GAMM|nr:Ni/Fe-hydrogenase, b-type cytochrome subunit [Shewanella cyperi]QSX28502.1 Ni/Fe-hydrogenase, b-type cytochrome subunit [Shewanella cyperi]
MDKHIQEVREFKRTLVFTGALRAAHWLRAAAITVLLISGFYLAWPFLVAPENSDVLVQGWIRFGHLIAGFLLCAVTAVRTYLFFFSRYDVERRSVRDLFSLKSWIAQLKSYFWIGQLKKAGVYGPLQLLVYTGIAVASIFICITGLTLYAQVYHLGMGGMLSDFAAWITSVMGGLASVRLWHHYVAWVFIVFLVLHIYMAVWTGIRFKHNSVEVIVSGYDYHRH